MNKKRNNKGFSLVELIVVIAIMAVMVVVLAPAYLRYVDKARVQKDVSAISEVIEATKIAVAEEAVANEIKSGTTTIAIDNAGVITVESDNVNIADTYDDTDKEDDKKGKLYDEVTATTGATINLSSKVLKATGASVVITVTYTDNHNISFTMTAPAGIVEQLNTVAPTEATPTS